MRVCRIHLRESGLCSLLQMKTVEREKFKKSNEGFLNFQRCQLSLYGKFYEWKSVFPGIDVSGDACVFGGWLIAHGQMEAADLAMYALYIGIFISPIQILVELTEMMQKGLIRFSSFSGCDGDRTGDCRCAEDAKPLDRCNRTCLL